MNSIIKTVLAGLLIAAASCTGKEDGNDNPLRIYARGNDGNKTTGQIINTSSGAHRVNLKAAFVCAATREVASDETVRLAVDNNLVAEYNARYGIDYLAAPEGSYEFSHNATATIKSGNFHSEDTITLTITQPENFKVGTYLLPIRLHPATCQPSSNFGVIYVILHSSFSYFHGADKVAGTLVDPDGQGWLISGNGNGMGNILGNINSYWYITELPATAVINFNLPKTMKGLRFVSYTSSYAIGELSLAHSNDGATWNSLGTETLLPPVKYSYYVQQHVEFYLPVTARYLKLTIEKSRGAGVLFNLFSIITE
ncbi:MAG: DUF1735 domain-containing protein [Prevotellaceae bacterium]|jgi:hypothetical protein|nr:DUF1735 domain-containing protein [Prevotellaceae bacterium]